ncbi:ABC transporter permease subunit [Clostridiaceae bacterium M8S5]|nr:ABC transporter permease subunit [Clostridiaceae bacterium M8S5]
MKNRKPNLLFFIIPSLCGLLIFYLLPFILSFYYTFINNMVEKKFIGLANFVDILENPMFRRGLRNQSLFIAVAVPTCLTLALIFVLQLKKLKTRQWIILLISFIPFIIPSGTIVYFWKCIFDVNGLLNKILYILNIPIIDWYNSRWVMVFVVIMFIWKNIGITAMLLYVGLNSIPKEYYEIADIEGMSNFQKFTKITLVYLSPVFFIAVLLLIYNSFKIFKEVFLLFGSYPCEKIYMLQHFMNNQFFSLNLQKLTSASFILFLLMGIIVCILFFLQKKYSDLFSTINFDVEYKGTCSKKKNYPARGFSYIITFLIVLPIIFIISNSFMSSSEIINRYTSDITLDNIKDIAVNSMHFVRMGFIPDNPTLAEYFKLLFRSPEYLRLYWNSIILVVPILVGQCIISPLCAYGFEQSKLKYKEVLFFIYIIIMLMPFQVLLVPNYLVSNWLGFNNTYLAIILPAIFNPIGVFIIRLQIKGFPKECIEAAQNDGATHFQIFRYILLPNIKSSITILSLIIFAEYWNIIDQAIIFIKNTYSQPLSIYMAQIVQKDLGMFFATSCFYLIPVFILLFIEKKYLFNEIIKNKL